MHPWLKDPSEVEDEDENEHNLMTGMYFNRKECANAC